MITCITPDGDRFIAPRQIAATIAKHPDYEVRSQMLLNVPSHWQKLVRKHLEIRMDRIKQNAKRN